MDDYSKKQTSFIIIDNFDARLLMCFLEIDPSMVDTLVYPSERDKNKFVRIWRTLFSYNKHRIGYVKNVYIFNDSSYRVQKILSHISNKGTIFLIEEGVAPYLEPTFENGLLHAIAGRLLPYSKSCLLGYSGIYDYYMIVHPELAYSKIDQKKIRAIDKSNYIYEPKIKVDEGQVVIVTSPTSIDFNVYKKHLDHLISIFNNPIFLKIHPLEESKKYDDLVEKFSSKLKIIPNIYPVNAIGFEEGSRLVSLSFSSALLYANNKKCIYRVPEDKFPYGKYETLFKNFGINVIDIGEI